MIESCIEIGEINGIAIIIDIDMFFVDRMAS